MRATGGQITFPLKRSDPAFLARLAMPIACPVASDTPHRAVPGLLAQQATGRYRVVEQHVLGDRPHARQRARASCRTAAARARPRAISVTRLATADALQEAIRSGSADLSLDDLPAASKPALAVPS